MQLSGMSITLHHFPQSPNAFKVLLVLHHLRLDYAEEIVDLTQGGTHTPEYMKLNPNALMPTLVDGDFVLWESNAIILYLAERQGSDLLPTGLRQKADVHRWLSWQLAHWSQALGPLTFEALAPHFIPGYQRDEASYQRGMTNLKRYAPVLDAHLKDRKYMVADRLTLADFAVASPMVHWRLARIPLEEFENLQAWYSRLEALEAWKKALPQMPA